MAYLWLKAIHLIAVVAWMAGLLYLPRLFVYHSNVTPGGEASSVFKTMERRLLRIIMNPAMILVWASGLWLAGWSGFYRAGWLHAKIALVLILSGLHGFLAKRTRQFAADANPNSARFYRIINEAPTVLMIGAIILAVVKPF